MRSNPRVLVSLKGSAAYENDTVSLRLRIEAELWEQEKMRLLGRGDMPSYYAMPAEIIAPPDTLWCPHLHEQITVQCPMLRVSDRTVRARRGGTRTYTVVGVHALPTRTKKSNRIHRFMALLSLEDLV